jgi:hypothetical protein
VALRHERREAPGKTRQGGAGVFGGGDPGRFERTCHGSMLAAPPTAYKEVESTRTFRKGIRIF